MPPIGSVPFVLGVWFSAIVGAFLWRYTAARLADKPLGQAMAAIYS